MRRLADVNWARVLTAYACVHVVVIVAGGPALAEYLSSRAFLVYNFLLAWGLHCIALASPQYPWLVRACNPLAVSFLLVAAGSITKLIVPGLDLYLFALDVSSVFYLASYVLLILGVYRLSIGLLPEITWRGRTHDGVVLAVGMGILVWFLIAAPLMHLPQSLGERLLNVAYPTAVLLTFLFLIPLFHKAVLPGTGRGAPLFTGGLAGYLASDLLYQVTPYMHGSFLGMESFVWGDIAYVLFYVVMAAGASSLARDAEKLSHATPEQVASARGTSALALFILAAVYIVLWRAVLAGSWASMTVIAVCWGIITILVVLHGVISIGENHRLIRERAHAAAQEKMWNVIRNLHVGVIVWGLHGEIRFVNPAARELLGMDEAELAGRTLTDPRWKIWREDGTQIPAEEVPAAVALKTGRPQRNVVVAVERHIDGGVAWLMVNAEPHLAVDGTVDQVTCTLVDIAGRMKLEAHLRDAQRMDSIGQLSAGIAHDFNNLLTVIFGSAELLRERCATREAERELIDDIMDASGRAATLTAQLLAFGRRQMMRPEVLDINEVLTGTEKMLRRTLAEDLDLRLELAPGPVYILADRGQMEQVIVNLSINARDAMPNGGKLTISTRVHVNTDGVKGVSISVQDTGHGMDEAVRRRVFEPFFTTKPVGKGSGLGLSVVHGIVKQSGGEIDVQSIPGIGSTFTIFMPLTRRAEQARQPGAGVPPSALWGTGTVMVVEDDDSVRAVMRTVLQRAGYQILEAASGTEGKRLAQEFQGRLGFLVTDVIMPGCSGPELMLDCRKRWPDLPVLFVSGYTDDPVGPLDPSDSRTRFLQKPFTHTALRVQLLELTNAAAPRAASVS
ncbi:MAG: response regulator [Gammaproteobacteria bacterium]|nr:response regulator [Gammaproteobacteria bacterium]